MANLPVGTAPNDPNRGATPEQFGKRPPPGLNSWDEYNYWKQNDEKGRQAPAWSPVSSQPPAVDERKPAASFFDGAQQGGVQPISTGGAQQYTGQPMSWMQQPAQQQALAQQQMGPQIQSQPAGMNQPQVQGGFDQAKFDAIMEAERRRLAALPGEQANRLSPLDLTGPQIQPQQGGTGGFNYNPAIGTVNTGTPGTTQQPQLDPSILQNFYGGQQSPGGTAIDPNNSLRGQQFLPGGTQNPYDQQALAALNGIQGGQVQNQWDQQAWDAMNSANMPTEFSPMVGETRDMIMDRLRGLSGPDRTQLAQEAFDIFQAQNEPRYQQELRGVGQKAAALGRVGAGMTTNDLTGVWGQRNRELDLLQRSLINDAAGQTLNDRLNTLNATIGGSSTLEGQDFNRQNAALQSAFQRAGMAGQFGQNQFGREQSNAGLGLDRAGMLAGMGQDQFGREKSNYQQNSQERAYQDYLARTALEDRIRQQQMEQDQAQREWERQYAANQLAAQLARGQDSQFPGIAQPRGDSFGTGMAAGQQNPGMAQPTYNPGLPPSMFDDNPGLGLQDPSNWGVPGGGIFGDDPINDPLRRLGMQRLM